MSPNSGNARCGVAARRTGCLGPDDAACRTTGSPDRVSFIRGRATLCRQTPEVGAVCGKAARTVLCGGRPVMGVPTATVASLLAMTTRTTQHVSGRRYRREKETKAVALGNPASGQCLCGKVAFEIDVPARWAWHDHSAASRRAHGAAYATYVGSWRKRFRITKGKTASRATRTRDKTARSFCSTCGSRNRCSDSCIDAFSSREPLRTSLENAMLRRPLRARPRRCLSDANDLRSVGAPVFVVAHPSRRGLTAAPQDEVVTSGTKLDPHGEERGNATRFEP